MFNLLCELHFWSQKDGILVDNSDFGAFVFQDRKPNAPCPIQDGKKAYCEGRGLSFSLNNKRPKKLKDCLVELEEVFYENRVVRLEWKSSSVIRAVFDSGLQYYIKINVLSGDPEEFVQDKFMVGKLSSHYISDVAIYSHHAVFAFTDNHAMHAHLSKHAFKQSTKKWNALDVKIQNVELPGPSGRRLEKTLSFNVTGDMILMWWKCGRDEVYPWSPQVKAEDRANVHIYSLNGSKFDLVSYFRTKFDPVSISFSKIHPSTVYTIQQRVTDDGEVTLEWENAQLDCRQLHSSYSLSLPLPTHISALALSPHEDKLLATCIDGSLLVADSYGNIANRIRTNLIPSLASWHPDGALILIGNNKGQLQWFDSALTSVSCQIVNQDASSSTLDVGCYFKYQPNLVGFHWNRLVNSTNVDEHNDYLLLQFEKGPLVILKLLRSHDRKLASDTVSYQYLVSGAYHNAINLLHTIDWEVDSELAMSTLQSIVSFLMRQPLSPATESAIEKSLGCFLNPIRPIPESISSEAADAVHDMARKFFHLLLRHQCLDTAFRLAIDLGKRDLFMDIYNFSKNAGNLVMAAAAWERANDIECSSCDDGSGSSCDCSESHSSECSSSSDGESESTQELKVKIVPPLLITSPLESSRTKVGYSSILQQHNYRRNPPKILPPPGNSIAPSSAHPPTSRKDYCSQPAYVRHYLKRDLNGTCLPESFDDETLLIEDSCVVHHPNVPSSRAPLQFNSHSVEHVLPPPQNEKLPDDRSSKLYSSSCDQNVGIPYSLKVANARRKKNDAYLHPVDDHSSANCLRGERDVEFGDYGLYLPSLRIPNVRRKYQQHSVLDEMTRMQPDGMSTNGMFTENPVNIEQPSNSIGMHLNPVSPPSFDKDSSVYANVEFGSALAKQSHLCEMNSSRSSNVPPDVIDVSKKPSDPLIVASAETEDGKIKVVHFGLV